MFRWGIVAQVDPKTARVRVTLPEEGDVLSWWLPVLSILTLGAKVYALPRAGALVAVLDGPGGEPAAVAGGVFNAQDAPPAGASPSLLVVEMDDGSRIALDPVAKVLDVSGAGAVKVRAAQALELSGASVTVTGPVVFKGAATFEAALDAKTSVKVGAALSVGGDLAVKGKTPAHHTHPVSGSVAQAVP